MTKELVINLINEKENEIRRLQEEIDGLKRELEIYDNNLGKKQIFYLKMKK